MEVGFKSYAAIFLQGAANAQELIEIFQVRRQHNQIFT